MVSQQDQAIGLMSRLVNALLDISKLESGRIHPEPIDFPVSALFDELRREYANVAAAKELDLRIESCSDFAHSDPSLVAQILNNLVSNAIRYTNRGLVELRCLHEAAGIRLEVRDTGVGIAPSQLSFIFDEFYQVVGPARQMREGYGLGLSIVKRLVELQCSGQPQYGQQMLGDAYCWSKMTLLFARRRACCSKSTVFEVTAAGTLREALEIVRRDSRVEPRVSSTHCTARLVSSTPLRKSSLRRIVSRWDPIPIGLCTDYPAGQMPRHRGTQVDRSTQYFTDCLENGVRYFLFADIAEGTCPKRTLGVEDFIKGADYQHSGSSAGQPLD